MLDDRLAIQTAFGHIEESVKCVLERFIEHQAGFNINSEKSPTSIGGVMHRLRS